MDEDESASDGPNVIDLERWCREHASDRARHCVAPAPGAPCPPDRSIPASDRVVPPQVHVAEAARARAESYVPSRPGRRLLWTCNDGSLYEQDRRGRVYADGRLLCDARPAAFATARGGQRDIIAVGQELRLFFLLPVPGRRRRLRLETHTTPSPVAHVVSGPEVQPPLLPRTWLWSAHAGQIDRDGVMRGA